MGFLESVLGWKSKWFYAKDTPSGTDEPLVNMDPRVAQRASWKNVLTLEEIAQTDEYISRIEELKDTGLTGVQLSGIFLKLRIEPLQTRAQLMWEYRGVEDTSRVRTDELSSTELETFLRNIIKSTTGNTALAVEPYSAANPPPAVNFFLLSH